MYRVLLFVCCLQITRGVEIYHKYYEMCCDGNVQKMPNLNKNSENYEIGMFMRKKGPLCCGEHAYDALTSICSNGRVYDLHPDSTNNESCENERCILQAHFLKESFDFVNFRCCEETGTVYDFNKKICCNNSLINREVETVENVKLFLDRDYNFTIFKNNLECCGGKTIDTEKEICCRHTNKEYSLPSANEDRKNLRCCGSSTYSIFNATCCDDHLIYGRFNCTACCGNKLINTKTQLCINRKPIWKRSGNEFACGSSVMNLETHRCINHTPIAKDGNEKWWEDIETCGLSFYDRKKQLCCSGEIVDVPEGKHAFEYRCCEKVDKTSYIDGDLKHGDLKQPDILGEPELSNGFYEEKFEFDY